jgi:hypothetical protein
MPNHIGKQVLHAYVETDSVVAKCGMSYGQVAGAGHAWILEVDFAEFSTMHDEYDACGTCAILVMCSNEPAP